MGGYLADVCEGLGAAANATAAGAAAGTGVARAGATRGAKECVAEHSAVDVLPRAGFMQPAAVEAPEPYKVPKHPLHSVPTRALSREGRQRAAPSRRERIMEPQGDRSGVAGAVTV